MTLTNDEARELNRERIDAATVAKAEVWKEQVDAARERGFYLFLLKHSGAVAVMEGEAYLAVEANNGLLLDYLKNENLPVNEQSLEVAFQILRGKGVLATAPVEEYERKADTQKSMFVAQTRHQSFTTSVPEPKRLVGVTREQVKAMAPDELRKLLKQGFGRELDRILNSQS